MTHRPRIYVDSAVPMDIAIGLLVFCALVLAVVFIVVPASFLP